jgi:hypothetical protein
MGGAGSIGSKVADIGYSAKVASDNGMGIGEFAKLTIKGMFTDYWYW